ncbi:MAG: DUF63 family protein [Candidatus Aenigmarchaeota archaeon]|nr:DUF63 family protein [Candidatus Aenigmarchaeota archaeon]
MDFVYDYFLVPLMRNGWFNPVNSIVYGLILIAGIWAVFNLLKRTKVPVDYGLYISFIPFIAFAGVTRVLRDYIYFGISGTSEFFSTFGVYMSTMQKAGYDYVYASTGNNFLASVDSFVIAWFPTPGSYFITAGLALVSFFIALLVRRQTGFRCWKTMFLVGMLLFTINASLLPVNTMTPAIYIGAVTAGWTVLFFGLPKLIPKTRQFPERAGKLITGFLTPINSAVLSAHLFDATATFFAISMFTTIGGYGYMEQHFLSRWMMPYMGPGVMFLLKFIVVVPVLYYIDRYTDDKELSRFLKLVVFVLGAAPAARNFIRLMVGV